MEFSDHDLRMLTRLERELVGGEAHARLLPPRHRTRGERITHDLVVLLAVASFVLCLFVGVAAAGGVALVFGVAVLLLRLHRFPIRRAR